MKKSSYSPNLIEASQLLKAGTVVAMPTETVYGLAADITQQSAIEQIFTLKGRPKNHPLIIHISAITQLKSYALKIPNYAYQLANHFWPGPLTLVLYKSHLVGDWVTGGQNTVGIRMPNHPLALELIQLVGSPLAAPSANRFGKISPTQVKHVHAEFDNKVAVVDGGDCQIGIESTIVDATDPNTCTILRPGMITEAQIQAIIGSKIMIEQFNSHSRQVSGTLKSHYAPTKPAFLFQDTAGIEKLREFIGEKIYGIVISEKYTNEFAKIYKMPQTEKEYAQAIYAVLRKADVSQCDSIVIEIPPVHWVGIRDRLKRSCSHYQQQNCEDVTTPR